VLRSFLISALLFASLPELSSADKGTVLVFAFENQSEDRTLDWIGEGIAELMIERLRAGSLRFRSRRAAARI
jgi:TolB-like protein